MSFKCQSCLRAFPNKHNGQHGPERVVTRERIVVSGEQQRREIAQERSLCVTCATFQKEAGVEVVYMRHTDHGLVPMVAGVSA